MRMRHPRSLLGRGIISPLSAWSVPSLVRSVQAGTVAVTGLTGTATITAVDIANTVLFLQGYSVNDGGNLTGDMILRATLTNSTTITGTRGTNVNASARTVAFVALEFVPGVLKSVQYGTVAMAGNASATATITRVDTAKAWVNFLGHSTTNGGTLTGQIFCRAALTNATTVTTTLDLGLANTTASFVVAELF